MPNHKLAHKEVFIKLVGLDHPRAVRFIASEDGGVWVKDEALALELTTLTAQPGLPTFLGKPAAVFVPFSQLQWMMCPTAAVQS
jgi:hypothetical protein